MSLCPKEEVVRLLFSDRMIGDAGVLTVQAFPIDELIESNGKSVSVDRTSLLTPGMIEDKLVTYENPERGRERWGWCAASVSSIIQIVDQKDNTPVFDVREDQILNNFPPNPWDHAHAKIVRAHAGMTKGFIRGYRDKLLDVFQGGVKRLS